jgi:endonuclease YncB( thermonuclease family)
MAHDFVNFPELTNSQMQLYYWESPHKQITEDFTARVIKVHDGDTITVRWEKRDFDFPVRLQDIDAPELNTGEKGKESKEWLESKILNEDINIILSKKRVEKWGRILGKVIHKGIDIGEDSVRTGHAISFDRRREGEIPNINKILEIKWLK